MGVDSVELGRRLRLARQAAGVSQEEAQLAIGVSQPTYSRIESGTRELRADELILLADRFGIRTAALIGLEDVRSRAKTAARTNDPNSAMVAMQERLYAYLELDQYLTDQGIPGGPN